MKTYSVNEIAALLDTNPETVRRWIRNNELIAEQTSRKAGNQITEANLLTFLRSKPKYTAIAGKLMTEKLLAQYGDTPVKDLPVVKSPIEQLLAEHIVACEEAIHQKETEIQSLREEIGKYQAMLKTLKKPLSEI